MWLASQTRAEAGKRVYRRMVCWKVADFLSARCRCRIGIPRVVQGHATLAEAEAAGGGVGATGVPTGSSTLRRQVCDVTGHQDCRISNWELDQKQ